MHRGRLARRCAECVRLQAGVDERHVRGRRPIGVPTDGSLALYAHVTFWGAQWWKDNVLSEGVAPPSFKGFADTANVVPPECTTESWATRPGDSSEPFAAPLPDTIPVVVASKVTKSGPVISGDSPAVVSVKVDPGYDSNPGHPGTGTITGLICPGGVGND